VIAENQRVRFCLRSPEMLPKRLTRLHFPLSDVQLKLSLMDNQI